MSDTPTIVITEFMESSAVEALREKYVVHYDPELVDQGEAIYPLLENARALIVRNRTQVNADLLTRAPKLEVVGRLGVGLDNIDLDGCQARRIVVHPALGANARAVAEYVLAMTLIGLRGAYDRSDDIAAGKWPRAYLSDGREAYGKTLGLVGFGDIGQLTAKLAGAIGLRVIAHDPAHRDDSLVWAYQNVEPVGFEQLLAEADVVSLHLPLNAGTRGLFGRETLARLKPGALLINTARGGIVDEAALADALRSGHLSGAAIDVFAQEPLAAGSPLAGLPNVWLTPHIAGLSREANVRVSKLIAERVAQSLG
ncbi:MAG: 3-phosphoglycerate dehydrogenase [Rhodocyclales bacterium GT-UBC]|nr:MAG: 3-phosphoglycerate dehydrogenase [Rhodocyclales bacterium GT-UBC]